MIQSEGNIKKLQQFYTLKFSSERLKKAKYDINISLSQARINSELVSINNSELLRALFLLKNIKFSQNELENLLKLRKSLKKLENSEENRIKIKNITENIEKMIFIEDLVTVEFSNKTHYTSILNRHGFYINGIRFVPFMASAGMIRRNTAMFINNNLKHPLMDVLENGRDESVPIVAAKFGAYFSLYASSSLPVSFPRLAVVPDKEIQTLRQVDYVEYQGIDEDDSVTTGEYLLKLNAWDGQGLISPRLAHQWSKELELDYTFSCAILRAPFLKGLVVAFDFEKFAIEIAGSYKFTDIYGDEQDIREVDLIVSESMLKLYSAYKSTTDYVEKCGLNHLGFSVAKVNPKKESNYSRTSYQFLQVLNLDEVDVAKLCEPTLNWFRNISGNNANDMMLYATGENRFTVEDFAFMDASLKAIMMNPELARDRYIQKKFINTIEKKKKESYMGSLLVNANYQFMIADPYYQACHIFKLNEEPLLKDGEHYSEYWLSRGIQEVAAIRSPIVHHSEVNVLHFKDNMRLYIWYEHIHSGIIFPANGVGIDCAIHGGADFDGDLVCTINNPIIVKCRIPGIPVVYESKKAEKVIVDSRDDKKQVESQLRGYNSKVGFATNISSSLYCMAEEFPEGSPEKEAIMKRLKIGRVIQGEIIDGVKGLEVPAFRNHWTKFKKITDDMPEFEKKKWELFNRIVCEVRPTFFRFLYPHYMALYNKELRKYNIYSHLQFLKSFEDIFKQKDCTLDEEKLVKDYVTHSFFLDNNSPVNRISRYMRTNAALISQYSSASSQKFDYSLLKNPEIEINRETFEKVKEYLREYKEFKRGLRRDLKASFHSTESFIVYLRNKCLSDISSNESELATYAVEATYGGELSMVEFVWRMFPDGILYNISLNSNATIKFPIQYNDGDIKYLWNTYSLQEFPLEKIYED